MTLRFWIRVNTGNPQGMGHVMRMRGLHEQLTNDGYEVSIDKITPAPKGWIEVIDDYYIKPSNDAILIHQIPYCWFLRNEIRRLRRGRFECRNILTSYGGSNPIVDYPKALDEADLVIGACGVSALERAWLGIPSIAWRFVADQRENFLMLAANAAIIPGSDPDKHWQNSLRDNPGFFRRMSENAMQAVPEDSYSAFWSLVRSNVN